MPHLANLKEKIPMIVEKHLQRQKLLDIIENN